MCGDFARSLAVPIFVLACLGAGEGESAQAQAPSALRFSGAGAGAGMGRAPGLNTPAFTLECWLKLLGPGVEASSGTGGTTGMPLICRGRGEAVADPRDCNYFFAVRSADRVLVADFHDATDGASHPVSGNTHLSDNVWYHAAVTYDGATWKLYVSGELDGQSDANAVPKSDSIQHFSLGTTMNSAGTPAGALNGILDEVRAWNHARSQAQIQAGMYSEAEAVSGLIGCWHLNENSGGFAGDTSGTGAMGTLWGPTWVPGVSFASGLRVSSLAATAVSDTGAKINGTLIDLGGATSAQFYFRWGTSATDLDRTTAPQDIVAPGPFYRTLTGFAAGTSGYYRAVAATNGATVEGAMFSFLAAGNPGIKLNGSTDYVSMGRAETLGTTTFTLECWLKRTAAGQTATTGSEGIIAVPLITKGRDETEGGSRDCNYFLGIRSSDSVLAADFEEPGSGRNHPVGGSTPILTNTWNHVAATYDGVTWRLYLNGRLDGEATAGATPQHDSLHHFGVGTAMNTTGTPHGFFAGVLDEVRIWNYARGREEILSTLNAQVPSAPGLIGRWAFDEGIGTRTADSSGNGHAGAIASGTWASGAPFDINVAPDAPIPTTPVDDTTLSPGSTRLTVQVADPETEAMDVKFYGRAFTSSPPQPFRFVALPDTQLYSQTYPATFAAQTQWIVDHRQDMNIVYVAHEGDIVNVASQAYQWVNANAALSLLDAVPDLPLGLAVGNHEMTPNGDPNGTEAFNLWFPYTRYESRPWYGGHYGTDNDSHYLLFSGGGMDFIAIHMEYNTAPEAELLSWAGNLLEDNPSRRGIVVAHSIARTGNPASWTTQGSIIYNALKNRPNLFLMLCGHISGEGRRVDTSAGTVYTLMADYQSRDNGGDGWLRILEFVPGDDAINVMTYSPVLDRYENDLDSQFSLTYPMAGVPFQELGQVSGAVSGTAASFWWSNLQLGTTCEWYATASDGKSTTIGTIRSFVVGDAFMDLDGDNHVDQYDFAIFRDCLTGANQLYNPLALPPGCTLSAEPDGSIRADHDRDGDVDQEDFAILQRCYTVPGVPAQRDCGN